MTAAGRILLVLTEGGGGRGLGHVVRTRALADAWRDAGGVVRWMIDGDAMARSAAGDDADVTLGSWAQEPHMAGADVVVTDSYALPAPGRAMIGRQAAVPVFFEDAGRDLYPRGLVVDARLSAVAPSGSRATWLCGPAWQMLRPAFRQSPIRQTRDRVERVLIVMGGTDAAGLTARAAAAARTAAPDAEIYVVGDADDLPGGVMSLGVLDAGAMAQAMHDCDLAISAAGQTVSELAVLGVPTILVQAADNQAPNLVDWPQAAGFMAAGAADAGLEMRVVRAVQALSDPGQRNAISQRARRIVDGQGPRRLVARIIDELENA